MGISLTQARVIVCTTSVSYPLSFLKHTFVVTEGRNGIHRYEVFRFWGEPMPKTGVVYRDLFQPNVGNRRFVGVLARFFGESRFGVHVLAHFDVDEDVVEQIERMYLEYPHRARYRYYGPNSNTFTQWLLNHVGIQYTLPRIAVGRKY